MVHSGFHRECRSSTPSLRNVRGCEGESVKSVCSHPVCLNEARFKVRLVRWQASRTQVYNNMPRVALTQSYAIPCVWYLQHRKAGYILDDYACASVRQDQPRKEEQQAASPMHSAGPHVRSLTLTDSMDVSANRKKVELARGGQAESRVRPAFCGPGMGMSVPDA